MRFACQSCGKAYNLPEERIAEKSNVKLKCRVCGAIVEVKKQGELVAHLLDETEANKYTARVSEAPAPLTSITPDDDDDPDGATVSISEASINERGPLEFEMPGAAQTGFSTAAASALSSSASSAALSSSGLSSSGLSSEGLSSSAFSPPPLLHGEAGAEHMDTANVAPPLPPPPLSPSSLPPPPALRALDAEAAKNGSATNGAGPSNHSGAFFADSADPDVDESLTPELRAPVAAAVLGSAVLGTAAMAGTLSPNLVAGSPISPELAEFPAPEREVAGKDPLFKLKMLAAFATGVLIDRIVAGLFQ